MSRTRIAMSRAATIAILLSSVASAASAQERERPVVAAPAPLVVGETFTIASRVLGEERRINVYVPPRYGAEADAPLPVLYMPDGGIAEDFLHVAGLVQVSVGNGTMRPFLLVGIENTERRRDMDRPDDADGTGASTRASAGAARSALHPHRADAGDRRRYRTRTRRRRRESLAGFFSSSRLTRGAGPVRRTSSSTELWWDGAACRDGGARLAARDATPATSSPSSGERSSRAPSRPPDVRGRASSPACGGTTCRCGETPRRLPSGGAPLPHAVAPVAQSRVPSASRGEVMPITRVEVAVCRRVVSIIACIELR